MAPKCKNKRENGNALPRLAPIYCSPWPARCHSTKCEVIFMWPSFVAFLRGHCFAISRKKLIKIQIIQASSAVNWCLNFSFQPKWNINKDWS